MHTLLDPDLDPDYRCCENGSCFSDECELLIDLYYSAGGERGSVCYHRAD